MVLLRFSPLVAEARGSAGGLVASRGRGGAVGKNRTKPHQPNNARQRTVRALFTESVRRWHDVLSEAQREAWRGWAARTPRVNRVGQAIQQKGFNAYVRLNGLTPYVLQAWRDDPPERYGQAASIPLTMTVHPPNDAYFAQPGPPYVNDEDGHVFVLFIAHRQGPGRAAVPKGYRLWWFMASSQSSPPDWWPWHINLPFVVSVGDHVFARSIYHEPGGRVAAPFIASATVTPAP